MEFVVIGSNDADIFIDMFDHSFGKYMLHEYTNKNRNGLSSMNPTIEGCSQTILRIRKTSIFL